MNRWNLPVLMIATGLMGCGCDKKDSAASSEEEPKGAAEDPGEKKRDAPAPPAGVKFDKSISKKACEILTPALVAKTFDVPEAELKQMKIMGCIYTWKKKDGEEETMLEARLSMMRAHKTEEGAKLWFKNATTNRTGEELAAQAKDVTEKAKEREEIDTETKKKATGVMGSVMAEVMSKQNHTYEEIDGIGDEAKVAGHDGAIWVRVGNLTFTVSAYKGAPQPQPKLDVADLKDIKKIAGQSAEAEAEWMKKTHQERKGAAQRLAKVILKEL